MNNDEDDLICQVYDYIAADSYPEGCCEGRKRRIRRKPKKFIVKDGELFYKQTSN